MTGINRKYEIRNRSGKLVYGNLTEKLIGLFYEIHFQYGAGQKESLYRNAVEEKLQLNSIPYKKEVQIKVKSEDTNKILGLSRMDFVIDDKIVLELKAIKFTPTKMEQQIYSYLKNSHYKIGLLVNFGSSRLYIRRIIFDK